MIDKKKVIMENVSIKATAINSKNIEIETETTKLSTSLASKSHQATNNKVRSSYVGGMSSMMQQLMKSGANGAGALPQKSSKAFLFTKAV